MRQMIQLACNRTASRYNSIENGEAESATENDQKVKRPPTVGAKLLLEL